MLIFPQQGKHSCSSSLPALSMFSSFNSDNTAKRAPLPSTENTLASFPRVRGRCKTGEMIQELGSFPLHSSSPFPPFLQCWESNPRPSACQAKALLLSPALAILILNWLFTFLQRRLVPFPPSTGWAHSWLSLPLMKDSVLTERLCLWLLWLLFRFPNEFCFPFSLLLWLDVLK